MKKIVSLILGLQIFVLSQLLIFPQITKAIQIGDAFNIGGDGGNVGIGTNPTTNNRHLNSIGGFLSILLPNILVIAGIIIFFFILLGGFTMITNAGNPEKQKEGSQIITGAVLGFVIIFGAYWLIQIIGILLGFDILNPKGPGGTAI